MKSKQGRTFLAASFCALSLSVVAHAMGKSAPIPTVDPTPTSKPQPDAILPPVEVTSAVQEFGCGIPSPRPCPTTTRLKLTLPGAQDCHSPQDIQLEILPLATGSSTQQIAIHYPRAVCENQGGPMGATVADVINISSDLLNAHAPIQVLNPLPVRTFARP